MSRLFVVLLGLVVACGNSGGAGTDASGGGDDQPGDDGGGGMIGPRTVKLTLTNRPMNAGNYAFVVAFQDGSAPWQLAPAPNGDTYSFEINAPSYGVAFTCIGTAPGSTTQTRSVTSAHFAVGERTELTLDVPARCSDRQTMGNVMLNGTVTNRPLLGGTLVVSWGGRTAFVGSQTGNFQLSAPPGTHDLFVVHAVPEGNGDFYTDEVWVARDVAINGNTNRNINFAEAQSTSQYYVDVSSANDMARITTTTTLYTANGSSGQLVRENANWGTVALADAQMKTTDVYDQSIQVAVFGRSATVTTATNEPGDIAWEAPPAFGAVQSMVVTKQPYVLLQSTWPAYADVDGYTWFASQQLSGSQCGGNTNTACSIVWQTYLSPGVTGAMPGYRMPELATLTGWKPAFEFQSNAQILGSVTAYTSSAGAGDFPGGVPANGTVRTFMRSDYSTTP